MTEEVREMSIQENTEEKDRIYTYYEEDSKDIDDSPYNYAYQPGEEENEDEEELEEAEEEEEELSDVNKKVKSPFLHLLAIMFSPVQGWKSLRRDKLSVENMQSGCFYPLLAILALSKFSAFLYTVDATLSSVITQAVIAFVSYFFGYFCILLILSNILPKNTVENFENEYGKEYIIVGLSTLVLFSILIEWLPMLWPVLIFLPLWTVYILYKGAGFFKMTENQITKFMVLTIVSVIGLPILIDWGLNELLPY